ncbi:hypothetical protein K7I13_11485 [Brucepastera parasyntrophica]|uniref:hypothetical protein n=1 Tax=Brucepastera parasyntrophica TaxID=2880008 RepID=UPI00210C26C1|nr:hypothetical protein [Brucepastera parasyntrophica]ULQ59120.1 hypothetical protein K7I13_11485 [Brucepastera parasyntrophica]
MAVLANIEDRGVYAETSAGGGGWLSGSAVFTFGAYKSVEDAQGPFIEGGVSLDVGLSVGGDVIFNTDLDIVGGAFSIGAGVGGAEAHGRFGITGIWSLENQSLEE